MKLSKEQLVRMSRLLDEAIDLDKAGREKWLQALPPEHQDLKQALWRGLRPEPDIELPSAPAAADLPGDSSQLKVGDRVGPYLLTRELGQGGMARVWLAARVDGAMKREVALKIPALSMLRQDLARRFVQERDILAGLEHPHIARLYDAGVTADGLPYLALEYVPGKSLVAWADEHRLGISERIELFLQVLNAVHYAHERGVLHRDIKPSNVLVTDAGQVRLLDFGVAKLLLQPSEASVTRVYGRAFTPDYASPEHIQGEPLEPGSDVYSLGVMLYELLAGSRPYRITASDSAGLLEETTKRTEIEKPSAQLGPEAGAARATTQKKLARRLRGDLDAIVLKSLAKAPVDRYRRASALADDLRRYLSGDPVQARSGHFSYRLTKFVLRHQVEATWATAATILVAVAIAYVRTALPGSERPAVANLDFPDLSDAKVAPADDKSIAVLPFVDISEKHDQEYFADGLSEELIDHLSRSPNLRVIARTSSFYFKGKQVTIHEIADALHVSHVLEGSVRKAGRELRITAQLIRASDGSHLWSKTFDRNFSDIFKVQEEIAATVAKSLNIALGKVQANGLGRETNAEAYNLLLQGNHFSYLGTNADNEKAIQLFREAIELDPNYALAWVRLADSYSGRSFFGSTPEVENVQRARRAVSHALDIDPRLPDAYLTLANLKAYFDWDWSGAKGDLERARALDRRNPHVRLALADLGVSTSGRINEAILVLQRELARDPLLKRPPCWLGFMLYSAGRFEESETAFRSLLQHSPNYANAQAFLARSYLLEGKYSEALGAVEKESDESWKLAVSPMVYWALGRRQESDASLAEEERKYAAVSAYLIAQSHAYRGEPDTAFEWLDRAYRQHNAGMRWILVDPLLRNLHNDPRFKTLLAKMNVVGYGAAPS